MRSDLRRAAFFCLTLMLAACGGGGGASHPPVTSGSGGSGTGSGGGGAAAQATVSISVHPFVSSQASKRSAAFVAPTTESATFQVVAINGQTATGQPVIEQDLVAGAAGCATTGATVTCSATVPVIVGTVTFQVKTYDHTGAQGTQLGTAVANATIVANAANRIALTVSGIIAQVQLFVSPQSLTAGTAGKSLLVVVPQDANGNIIVNPGNYDQPIQLSISGGTVGSTAHVGFEEDGATTPASTATVTSPNDQVYVAYDGATGTSNADIIADVAEATPVSAAASLSIGTTSLTTAPTGTYVQNAGFAFTGGGQSGTISISGGTPPYQASFTAPPGTLAITRSTRAGSRGGIHIEQNAPFATASVTGSSVTVSSIANEYGSGTLYVYDSATPYPNVFTYPVSVSAPAVSITVPTCPAPATCSSGQIILPSTTTTAVTLDYSGGTGTYTNTFASTGSSTSACGSLTGSGSIYTFTSNGSCSDLLIVTSGNQSAYYAIVQSSGTAAYTVASTSHAYVPAGTTGEILIADGGQASIDLTTGNGPWTASQTGCAGDLTITGAITSGGSPTLNNSGFVLSVSTNPTAVVNTCQVTFTPTNGSPVTVQAVLYPKLAISAQSVAYHAPGDSSAVTVTNGSPAIGSSASGLSLASGSIEIADNTTPGVITNLTYSGGTSGGGNVGFIAGSQTGSALISIHDTNFDEKFGVSVSVDNAYAQQVPSAIGLDYGITGYATPTTYTNTAIPTWATAASDASLTTILTNGSPTETLSLTPLSANSSSLTLTDYLGGSITIPVTSFQIGFSTYQGSLIGATAAEAFPGVGLSDTVTVNGPNSSISVVSSDPNVVSISGVGSNTFTATSASTGFSTITITDTSNGPNGPTISYPASVTNVTIPVDGHGRRASH